MSVRASSLVSALLPHLTSGATLIVISTNEEERARAMVNAASDRARRASVTWEAAQGFSFAGGGAGLQSEDALSALETIGLMAGNPVIILVDFHEYWHDPAVKRRLRTLAMTQDPDPATLIIITPEMHTPSELADHAVLLRLGLPESEDLLEILQDVRSRFPTNRAVPDDQMDTWSRAALGLTANQARRSFARAMAAGELGDPAAVRRDASTMLRRTGFLDVMDDHTTVDDLGGLRALKDWVGIRRRAFDPAALPYGLQPPRGLAFIGPAGSGKTLATQAIGDMWGMPTITLDIPGLLAGDSGDAVDYLRGGLEMIGRRSPCLLAIDRLDLALAHGGNSAQRVASAVISWVRDAPPGIVLVATSNEVDGPVGEFVRRSRFDEVFFFDLPSHQDREEIAAIHLRKRSREPHQFDLGAIAAETQSQSGADIERAIVTGMYQAFNEDRDVTTEDILRACRLVLPYAGWRHPSVSSMLTLLRDGNAQSANYPDRQDALAQSPPDGHEHP